MSVVLKSHDTLVDFLIEIATKGKGADIKLEVVPDRKCMWATLGIDAALQAFLWPGQNGCKPEVNHV